MSIKTWRERMADGIAERFSMLYEINELRAKNQILQAEVNLYKSACDRRDAKLDKLKKQEPVAHVEVKHMVEARFHTNCEYGCALPDGTKLYLAAGAQPQAELTDEAYRLTTIAIRECPTHFSQDWQEAAMLVCRAVLAAQKAK